MCAFVVLGFVFSYHAKRLAWERLQNYLFCVEWDVKPELVTRKKNIHSLTVPGGHYTIFLINFCHLLWSMSSFLLSCWV